MIKAAKTSLACWHVDTQAIWDRFVAFNKARGNSAVPAGFLLGFMRKWRSSAGAGTKSIADADPRRVRDPAEQELRQLLGKHHFALACRTVKLKDLLGQVHADDRYFLHSQILRILMGSQWHKCRKGATQPIIMAQDDRPAMRQRPVQLRTTR
jgi:hypothetical protein